LESGDVTGSLNPTTGTRVDTLFVVDTVIIEHGGKVDTVIVVDTIIQVDTVIVTDTTTEMDTVVVDTTVVDTVIIIEPGGSQMLCDRLACAHKEIVWLFRNAGGSFHLEFAALPESEHPNHTLTVTIGEQKHCWDLSKSLELILDATLPANATIIITTSKPRSFGHAIDICLTVTRL
jgi:hypothetical protein